MWTPFSITLTSHSNKGIPKFRIQPTDRTLLGFIFIFLSLHSPAWLRPLSVISGRSKTFWSLMWAGPSQHLVVYGVVQQDPDRSPPTHCLGFTRSGCHDCQPAPISTSSRQSVLMSTQSHTRYQSPCTWTLKSLILNVFHIPLSLKDDRLPRD